MKPTSRHVLFFCLAGLSLHTQAQQGVVLYGQTDLAVRYTDNDDGQRGNT